MASFCLTGLTGTRLTFQKDGSHGEALTSNRGHYAFPPGFGIFHRMRAAKRENESRMHTREAILKTLAESREEVRRFGVRSLGLFGSAARGETTAASDLDFLVEFENPSFDSYMGLLECLEKLFGRRVDLVLANALKPRLRELILHETVHAQGL